ncbi:MAG: Tfp pilus assembly protein PilX, partial [Gammaproteobacteria bacterium]
MQSNSFLRPRAERGAALVTALVLLTVVTMLAITSMGTNTLEEKMAANSQ